MQQFHVLLRPMSLAIQAAPDMSIMPLRGLAQIEVRYSAKWPITRTRGMYQYLTSNEIHARAIGGCTLEPGR